MQRYSIPANDYLLALQQCQDDKYKRHLLNDFVQATDGRYYPRIDRRFNVSKY